MSYYLAPSLVLLRNEVNKRWPNRSKVSDGWIGDAAHSARTSDHNPDWSLRGSRRGVVRALDITTSGIDVDLLLKHTTNDARVAYVIYNWRIYQHSTGWKPYKGKNGHVNHVHISIRKTAAAENQTFLWFGSAAAPSSPVKPGGSTTPASANSLQTTNSIVKYLDLKNRDSSFKARAALAKRYGIRNYKGTAAQNTLLLSKIRAADNKAAKVTTPKANKDPNRYTVRSEEWIRKTLLPITTGTEKNTTPHLIGLYQRQQNKPFELIHDQIWGRATDAHYLWVGELQERMNQWKGTKLKVDNNYGPATHNRVREIQENNKNGTYKGYNVDGFAGPVFCKMIGMEAYPN